MEIGYQSDAVKKVQMEIYNEQSDRENIIYEFDAKTKALDKKEKEFLVQAELLDNLEEVNIT